MLLTNCAKKQFKNYVIKRTSLYLYFSQSTETYTAGMIKKLPVKFINEHGVSLAETARQSGVNA